MVSHLECHRQVVCIFRSGHDIVIHPTSEMLEGAGDPRFNCKVREQQDQRQGKKHLLVREQRTRDWILPVLVNNEDAVPLAVFHVTVLDKDAGVLWILLSTKGATVTHRRRISRHGTPVRRWLRSGLPPRRPILYGYCKNTWARREDRTEEIIRWPGPRFNCIEVKNNKKHGIPDIENLLEVIDDVRLDIDALGTVGAICFRDKERVELDGNTDTVDNTGRIILKWREITEID